MSFDKRWAPHVSRQEGGATRTSSHSTGGGDIASGASSGDFSWTTIFEDEPTCQADFESRYGAGSHKFSLDNHSTFVIVEGPKLFVLATDDCELGAWLLDSKATSFREDPSNKKDIKLSRNETRAKLL